MLSRLKRRGIFLAAQGEKNGGIQLACTHRKLVLGSEFKE